MKVLLQN